MVLTRRLRATASTLGLGRARDGVRASHWWAAVPPRRIKDLDATASPSGGTIALTYDDGPDPVVTPRLLELLDSHSAHATFFMCGLAAKRHPDVVRTVAAAGHAIGGHSWDHRLIRGLTEPEWRRQVDDTHRLLEDLSGGPVRWFRPPRGNTDRHTREALRRRGVATVYWSASGRDWVLRAPEAIAGAVLADVDSGAIVLLHDAIADFLASNGSAVSQEPTVRATDLILRATNDLDLRPVRLSDLAAVKLRSFGRPRLAGRRPAPSRP